MIIRVKDNSWIYVLIFILGTAFLTGLGLGWLLWG